MEDFKHEKEPRFQEAKFHLKKAAEELRLAVEKMFKKGAGGSEQP